LKGHSRENRVPGCIIAIDVGVKYIATSAELASRRKTVFTVKTSAVSEEITSGFEES
jgi:hypothetical protein